jgi:trans-aconitate methyltransferase
MADWDAKAYARISDPQFRWGLRALERLPLQGDETVVDEGCGAGRLTEVILERLPRGRVIALDASRAMIETARERLARFGERVELVHADAASWTAPRPVDVVFSTATYHWVLDHDALFRCVAASLSPGGHFVAQCGAVGNLSRLRSRTAEMRARSEYARAFEGFGEPWFYAAPKDTEGRLSRAGFAQAEAWTEPAPTPFDSAASFAEFVSKVVLRDELARLANDEERGRYLAELVQAAADDDPPFTLDYVRLNIDARR